jgi:hypothetical protein
MSNVWLFVRLKGTGVAVCWGGGGGELVVEFWGVGITVG